MVISYTVPCHKRVDDLADVLPHVVAAANVSPPVEIVLVDYGVQDPIAPRLEPLVHGVLRSPNSCTIVVDHRREYYHMAHARNVALRAATGDYVIISATDIAPKPWFFMMVRHRLAETGAVWMQPVWDDYVGVIVCERQELIAAGGYDERFEYYGSEDKDLNLRLRRRGTLWARYEATQALAMARTSNAQKVSGYRPGLTKDEMLARGRAILDKNVRAHIFVANAGRAWGV